MFIKRFVGVLVLILLVVPVVPGVDGVGAASAEDPLVTDTRKSIETFARLWQENRLEELVAGYFTEDALMLPPNHEPVSGHRGILAYFKSVRDAAGEFDTGDYLLRATPSGGNTVSFAGQFTFHGGKLRITTHELFVRQPDGSMKCSIKMFGFRDPMA